MVEAQEWLDENYAKERKNKIVRLDITNKNLGGTLNLDDFVNLKELYCGDNQLTSLSLSNLAKLREIDCSKNRLNDLDLSNLSNLKSLCCHNNQLNNIGFLANLPNPAELTWLNISDNNFFVQSLSFLNKFINLKKLSINNNKFRGSLKPLEEMNYLEKLDISDTDVDDGLEYLPKENLKEIFCEINKKPEARCQTIKESLKNYYSADKETYNYKEWVAKELVNKLLKENEQLKSEVDFLKNELSRKDSNDNISNILLIGRTGNGKSTLANVITRTDKFKEGKYAVSETRHIQTEEFEHEWINYRIIDTVGIGDTKLTEKQVLDKIAEAAYSVRDGLHQILFVTSGRFNQDEIAAYDLPRKAIFDESIDQFITIIRTNFPHFESSSDCQKDIEVMCGESEELSKIIKSCNKVIHVENYPKSTNHLANSHSERTRDSSRNILLNHLTTCQGVYKPQHLQELAKRIGANMNKKERLERELIDLKRQSQLISEDDSSLFDRIEDLENELEKQKENIRRATKEHITEKGISWEKWIKIGLQGVGSMASIAAVVVAAACKIM